MGGGGHVLATGFYSLCYPITNSEAVDIYVCKPGFRTDAAC